VPDINHPGTGPLLPKRPDARLQFLGEFLRKPLATGAVLPSSSGLGRLMVDWLDFDSIRTIVEFGPGSGVFTTEILARSRPGTKFLGLEINPVFAERLRTSLPGVIVYGRSAVDVRECLSLSGCADADAIVSGLPWAFFSEEEQDSILGAATSVLRPGGAFATFAYVHALMLPAAQRFRKKLLRQFRSVEASRVAWRNAPPAIVYRCVK
jgi:phosphatidylethanolamine/phosphatidyl-N-methylethanolamine N-methyltransferase